ncbi:hypothetical protein M8C21_005921, partial [Ambrosia artemisiifolia]
PVPRHPYLFFVSALTIQHIESSISEATLKLMIVLGFSSFSFLFKLCFVSYGSARPVARVQVKVRTWVDGVEDCEFVGVGEHTFFAAMRR